MMTGFELGPLVSEVTALPTDPQPLPKENIGNYQTVLYYLEVVLKMDFGMQIEVHINVCTFKVVITVQLSEWLFQQSQTQIRIQSLAIF